MRRFQQAAFRPPHAHLYNGEDSNALAVAPDSFLTVASRCSRQIAEFRDYSYLKMQSSLGQLCADRIATTQGLLQAA